MVFRIVYLMLLICTVGMSACNKWSEEKTNIYQYVLPASQTVSDSIPLCGSIKGVMLSGKTYNVGCTIQVNKGDTLLIQSGVTVNMTQQAGILVYGTFLCIGSKAKPNVITVPGVAKNDTQGLDPSLDPAYSGQWKGILADTSCGLMVIKWTHIDFGGAAYGDVIGPAFGQSSTNSYVLLFQNYNGSFIMEDSWMYGSTDDMVRISCGKVSIMRNTFEKCGNTAGGDCINLKGGSVGNLAYNFIIGSSENGQKVSNKGQPVGAPQTEIRMYNNVFVNDGFRVSTAGSGADIDYEQSAKGMYYNNVVINCRVGPRVVGNPPADTANLFYGNNFFYADSLSGADQFYPVGYISRPQPTDLPAPGYLPANYALGANYDGSLAVQAINPTFINYPLPVGGGLRLGAISAIGSFNFRPQLSSPLIGKGYTDFEPLQVVPVDSIYGTTELTPPGQDLGCFQINGNGNHH
jgi:hypothetical protein